MNNTGDNIHKGQGPHSANAGGKRKINFKDQRKDKKKPKPSNVNTAQTETQDTPSYAQSSAPSYVLTDVGTALLPSLHRPNNTSFGRAATSDDEDEDEDDDDDDSDVEIVINPTKVIIDMTRNKTCLEMEGLASVDIYGHSFRALFHERQTCEIEPSYRFILLKNLIVVFQGLVLFEDCLEKRAFGNHWKSQDKLIVGSILQDALGYEVRTPDDNQTLYTIATKYKAARTNFILEQLRNGNKPTDPQNPKQALLIQLIDRQIVFDWTKSTLVSKNERPFGMARVAIRARTVKKTLVEPRAGILVVCTQSSPRWCRPSYGAPPPCAPGTWSGGSEGSRSVNPPNRLRSSRKWRRRVTLLSV